MLKTIGTFVPITIFGKSMNTDFNKSNVKQPSGIRFAVASDGHYGERDTAYEMYYSNIIKWLNQEAESNGLDLIIFNGDIIHDNPDFMLVVKRHFEGLTVPYFTVQGNHDTVTPSFWEKTWGYGVNHSFEKNNAAFILMTTTNEHGEYLCADKEWLAYELEKYSTDQQVFLFLHISQNDWTRHGIACPDLLDFIASSGKITAVFHGHDHHEDDVKYYKEVPFFWSGHFGSSWGQEYKGFRIVEVTGKDIITYMKNPLGKTELPEVRV